MSKLSNFQSGVFLRIDPFKMYMLLLMISNFFLNPGYTKFSTVGEIGQINLKGRVWFFLVCTPTLFALIFQFGSVLQLPTYHHGAKDRQGNLHEKYG